MTEQFRSINPDVGEQLYEDGPLTIPHADAPCAVHRHHSPVTIQNELHHVFPKYLQARVYGKNKVRDHTLVSVCGTGHTNVHTALTAYLATGDWPDWCIGKTRDLAEEAVARYEAAQRA